MVEPNTFDIQNWLNNKDKRYDIDHYDNCKYKTSLAPINEMPCRCYDMQLFLIGMEAQKDLFNEADRD